LGFLGVGRFAAKACAYKRWISLDFLGFSRPNRDLSMGYAGESRKIFSTPFFPESETSRMRIPAVLAGRGAELLIGQA
jgi:hypothetical protein